MRFVSLLIAGLLASFADAAPPKLTIPAELKPVGGYVTLKPETDAVSVTYVGLSGEDAFPSSLLKDGRDFVFPTRGLAEAKYRFAAVASSATGEQTRADFVVVVGTPPITTPPVKPGEPPPVTPGPITDPPVVTPPTKPASFYFLIVRAEGPADPAFTKTMGLAAWASLRLAGHEIKDFTLAEAKRFGVTIRDGTTLPCVVTLRKATDGKTSSIVRDAIALPTNETAILELPKGVTK